MKSSIPVFIDTHNLQFGIFVICTGLNGLQDALCHFLTQKELGRDLKFDMEDMEVIL